MTRYHITGIAAAMLLGTSTLAMGQTAPQTGQTQQPGAAAATQQPGMRAGMQEQDVFRRLEAQGYEDIEIQREGPHFVGTARRFGEDVDLRVLAATGRVLEPHQLTAEQITHRLEERGYENIANLEEENGEFRTTAERFGEEVELRVAARTGAVLDPRELTYEQIVTMLEDEDYENVVVFEREDDYGNFWAVAEIDGDQYLLQISPITGRIDRDLAAF